MRQFDQTRFLKPSVGYDLSVDNPISTFYFQTVQNDVINVKVLVGTINQ